VKVPLRLPARIVTSLEFESPTARSGIPSPLKAPTATESGFAGRGRGRLSLGGLDSFRAHLRFAGRHLWSCAGQKLSTMTCR